MNPLVNDIKSSFQTGTMTVRLIMINIGVFVLIHILMLFNFFASSNTFEITAWLAAPSSFKHLLHVPWTAITYMFLHIGFWHIFFNMIWLYFGGRIFGDLLNDRRLLATYFMGGIAGLILYMLAFNFIPHFHQMGDIPILGASAAIMALIVGIATYVPNYTVYLIIIGPVKLKWIAVTFVVLDVLQINMGNPGGHIAHLGGAIYGYFMSRQLSAGNDWSDGFYTVVDSVGSLFRWFKRPKMRVVNNAGPIHHTTKSSATTEKDDGRQEKLDAILDKISKSGYDSLTKAEKEFLFNASKK